MCQRVVRRFMGDRRYSYVVLTPDELAMCAEIALQRTGANRQAGAKNRLGSGPSSERLGVEAEYAYCRYEGVEPRLLEDSWAHTADCIAHGWRVDVKGTRGWDLKVEPEKKGDRVDVYVSVTRAPGFADTFLIVGYEWADLVWMEDKLVEHQARDGRRYHAYTILERSLRPIEGLRYGRQGVMF